MKKEEGLRTDLKLAQFVADSAARNMNTKPDEYAYWFGVFIEAKNEVARLTRELGSKPEASS